MIYLKDFAKLLYKTIKGSAAEYQQFIIKPDDYYCEELKSRLFWKGEAKNMYFDIMSDRNLLSSVKDLPNFSISRIEVDESDTEEINFYNKRKIIYVR